MGVTRLVQPARAHLTLDDYRKLAEDLKVEATRRYMTEGKYGKPQISEAHWLASLREGTRIKMLK